MNETSTQRRAKPWSRVDRDSDGPRPLSDSPHAAGTLRPTSGRFWGVVGLVILTGVTSLVVATISVWLTPVYMAAMVLIFAAPRSNRPSETPPPLEAPAAVPDDSEPASPEAVAVVGTDVEGAEGTVGTIATAEPAAEPAPPKPRKRRGKGKRAAKAAALAEASSTQPTWIRVGPGKFVRADVQAEAPGTDPPQETDAPTEADPALRDEAEEVTTSAPVAFEDAGRAVDRETNEEQAPAEVFDREPCENDSPGPIVADEAADQDEDGEYGIAPSALVDEEYGIAPSALVTSHQPEAVPAAVFDDEPQPAPEPSAEPPSIAEAEHPDQGEAQAGSEVQAEIEVAEPPRVDAAPEAVSPHLPVVGRSTSVAPARTATAPRLRPVASSVLRGPRLRLHLRERRGRPRTDRPARSSRSTLPGRTVDVRGTSRPGRDGRRSDQSRRRHPPRSPPRRP